MIIAFVSFVGGSVGLAEESRLASAIDDGYEVMIKDSVNWYILLNFVEASDSHTKYTGKLYYQYSGRDIWGDAKAVYDAVSDTLTVQCVDNWDEADPDYMAYGLVFNPAPSYRLRGGWGLMSLENGRAGPQRNCSRERLTGICKRSESG